MQYSVKFTFKDNSAKAFRKMMKAGSRQTLESVKNMQFVSQQLVPLDTGDLRSTADRIIETKSDNYYSAKFGYGGVGKATGRLVDYATDQHNNMSYNHTPGRMAKYLEIPFKQMVPIHITKLQEAIKRELKRR